MHEDLIAAVQAGDAARVDELLAADPGAGDARDANGVSALMLSRYHGAPPEVTAALRDARTELDLFEAATLGDVARLETLLNAGERVDGRSPDDATALHFAAFFAQPGTAKALVDRGADLSAVSKTFGGVTPLHSAAAGGSAEIVHLLLQAGADANARQEGGFVALHSAAQNGDVSMARDLLGHGADPAIATDDGRTALSIAEEQGHEDVAALLRGRG